MSLERGIVVLLSVSVIFILSSCNAAAPEAVPSAPVSGQENATEPEGTGAFDYVKEIASQQKDLSGNTVSGNIDLPKDLPEPPEAKPALYADDFTKAVKYEDYGKDGKAMTGDEICVEGYADSFDEEHHSLILITDEGNWAVSVGELGTENFYRLVEEAVGQYVRVFGKYTGYNDELSMPAVAFLPREFQYRPYRLESYDNSFRLTQLDYVFREPVYNTERTYGKITYMEPSSWNPELTEDTLFYSAFEKIPTVMLAHHEKVTDSGFDEIDEDGILAELAASYVQDGGEILEKTSFKLNGYSALRFETTWEDEDLPMPICMYCYMFIVDDEYYYYGTQEPYLVGESVRRALEEMLENMVVSEGSTEETAAEDKKESKTDKDTDDKDKTKEDTKEKDNKAETASDDKEAQEKKSSVPTKAELQGKVFTQRITADFVGKENNETFNESEDLPDTIITAEDLAKYDESTGRVTIHDNQNGMIMTMVLTFSYDSSGRIVYSGDLAIDDPQFIASGTVSGHMK